MSRVVDIYYHCMLVRKFGGNAVDKMVMQYH